MSVGALNRREALLAALASAAAGSAGIAPRAFAQDVDPVFAAFEAARETTPWTLGWANAPARTFATPALELIAGAPPEGLAGVLYRNGPGLHSRDQWRLRHWFDGDGLVHAWRIGEGVASHQARFVGTRKYQSEEAAGRFLYPGFGSAPPNPGGLTGPDDANAANTSVLPLGDTLYALWEGGSAWAMDPETLEARGPKTWRDGFEGMPFSAHPKIEPNGKVWNIGTDYWNGVAVYRISATGETEDVALTPLESPAIIHDFALTARSVVVFAPQLETHSLTLPIVDTFGPRTSGPILVTAYDKDGLAPRGRWELPPGFIFHFGNAWEEADGTIHVDFFHYPDGEFVCNGAKALMRGEPDRGARPVFAQAVLRPDGTSQMLRHTEAPGEFPRMDPRLVGFRHRYVWYAGDLADNGQPAHRTIARRDLETGETRAFDMGETRIAEEPVFVPRPGGTAEDDGWLVATALDIAAERMTLNVFDAARPDDGPVCTWAAPYALPLGFHGAWRSA